MVVNIKTTKLFSIFVLFILALSTVSAYDLSDFPDMFVESGEFRGYFIVGDESDPLDVISMIDIAVTLQAAGQAKEGKKIDVHSSRLASEVNTLFHNDAIVVGTPCENEWITELVDAESCETAFGLNTGDGLIKYVQKHDQNFLIVTGKTSADVRKASRVVAKYWENSDKLVGNEVLVSRGRLIARKTAPTEPELKMKPFLSARKNPQANHMERISYKPVKMPQSVAKTSIAKYNVISENKNSVLRKIVVDNKPVETQVKRSFVIMH